MAVPKISAEDRAKALEKAQKVRKERAAMRENMKAGKMAMKDVIAKSPRQRNHGTDRHR